MATDPHPTSAGVAYLGAEDLVDRFAAGALTSAAVVDTLLERIAALDDPSGDIGLRSMAAVAEDARAVAVERDAERARGALRGPLHGVPVAVKDNIEVTGLPGVAGSTALLGRPARTGRCSRNRLPAHRSARYRRSRSPAVGTRPPAGR